MSSVCIAWDDQGFELPGDDDRAKWIVWKVMPGAQTAITSEAEEKVALPDRGSAAELAFTYPSFHRQVRAFMRRRSSVVTSPDWLEAARTELLALRELPIGWDGYDAGPAHEAAVQAAARFLSTAGDPLTPRPTLVPGADGSVQVEWHTGQFDIEVCFPPDETEPANYYVADLLATGMVPMEGEYRGGHASALFGAVATMAERLLPRLAGL